MVCFAFAGCLACLACGSSDGRASAEADAAATLPRALKGYELYSWREASAWCFALLTGSNRAKSAAEIGPPDEEREGWLDRTVCKVQDLQALLARLPSGQHIVWSDGRHVEPAPGVQRQFGFPEASTVQAIQRFCDGRGLQLSVPPEVTGPAP